MAADPKARKVQISYPGGSAEMTQGLADYLFGNVTFSWLAPDGGPSPTGRRRLKYGTRRRVRAAGGRELILDLGAEGKFIVRVSGDDIDFIDYVLARTGDKVKRVFTRRGTKYGPQFAE